MPELFPSTPRTWITEQLDLGDSAAADVRKHILALYFQPLCGYAQASSLRELGNPSELVSGVLASRLSRADYLRGWRQSNGMPLRRWLMNGLHLYGHELRRASRNHALRESPLRQADDAPDPAGIAALDRAWALSIVREACAEVEAELRLSGAERDWYVFRRHFLDGRSYRELHAETSVEPARAAVRSHAILVKLRARIRALLARDGTPPDEIEAEIARLQRIIEDSKP